MLYLLKLWKIIKVPVIIVCLDGAFFKIIAHDQCLLKADTAFAVIE